MNISFRIIFNVITGVLVIIGGVIGYLIGPIDGLLYCLIVFMVIDYITGIIAAALIDKSLSSSIGFLGIAKKVMIIALVIVSNLLDMYIIGSGSTAKTAIISFYLVNEGISIIENVARLGLPIPESLLTLFNDIKCKDFNGNYKDKK